MSERSKRRRQARGEKKLGLQPGTAEYMEKVLYYKNMCDQFGYPWEHATELFNEATRLWGDKSPAEIVDHLAEEMRRNHVNNAGKLLRIDGNFLVPTEEA